MNDKQIQVLLVEDNLPDARLIREILAEGGMQHFEIEWIDRLSKALEYASTADVDIVLLDLSLPDSQGLETFTALHARMPAVPIIVLSGLDDERLAIKAVQDGAQDYLVKGQADSNLLERAISYAIERKKTERKLQEVAEIKSQFTSTVSHELRAPLTAIKEGISLVATQTVGELNDVQKELLDIAKRNVDRLTRLINNVLDFQKLEAGKMEFDVQENDINEVVREIEETMAPLVSEKGLNLITQLEETMPTVQFDRDKITPCVLL